MTEGPGDKPTADELDQLACSLAIDGSLGRRDAQRVAEVLRKVAALRRVSGQPS